MSFFREPFRDFVKNALTNRVNLLKEGTKGTSRSTNWYTQYVNKAAFLRVAPMVLITDENILKGKDPLEFTKNYVLEGAPLLYDGENFKKGPQFPGELGKTNTNSLLNNPNIRTNAQGGFGIVPPPGVTSFSINTKSFYGNLREAKLSIRCFNLNQFEIIEKLYSRPGYHVMVEWGWSHFLNDKGQPQRVTNLITSPDKEEFWGNKKEGFIEPDPLYSLIDSQKQQYEGCYDGFLGIIKNFSTKIENDGGFTIDVQLIGRGSLINSIKLDRSDKDTSKLRDVVKKSLNVETVSSTLKETKNNLYNILAYVNSKSESDSKLNPLEPVFNRDYIELKGQSRYIRLGYLFQILNKYCVPQDGKLPYIGINNVILDNDKTPSLTRYSKFIHEGPLKYLQLKEYLDVNKISNVSLDDRLGLILKSFYEDLSEDFKKIVNQDRNKIINATVNNLGFDLSLVSNTMGSFAPKDIIFPHQFDYNSINPWVIYDDGNLEFNLKNLSISKTTNFTQISEALSNGGLYPYLNQTNITQNPFIQNNPIFKSIKVDNCKRNIDNIFYNIDTLLDFVSNNLNNLTLNSLLESITNTINTASGNSLNLKVIDNPVYPNQISIVDFNINSIKSSTSFKFPKIGYTSIYKDLSITGKIPDAQASSIAISAVGSRDISNIESTTYNAFNKDVSNRVLSPSNTKYQRSKNSSIFLGNFTPLNQQSSQPVDEEVLINRNIITTLVTDLLADYYKTYLIQYIFTETTRPTTSEKFSGYNAMVNNKDYYNKLLNDLKSLGISINKNLIQLRNLLTPVNLPFTSFIPLNINITMEGISGILASNTFKLEEGMLPEQYNQERVSYVVTKEQQTVKGLTWETSLEGKIVLDDLKIPKNK